MKKTRSQTFLLLRLYLDVGYNLNRWHLFAASLTAVHGLRSYVGLKTSVLKGENVQGRSVNGRRREGGHYCRGHKYNLTNTHIYGTIELNSVTKVFWTDDFFCFVFR